MEADIHEKCLKASDCKGCIEVFSGAIKDQFRSGMQNKNLKIDTQLTAYGNQCPSEFVYAGGYLCRGVICEDFGFYRAGPIPIWLVKEWDVQKVAGKCVGENVMMKKYGSNNLLCPSIQLKKGS